MTSRLSQANQYRLSVEVRGEGSLTWQPPRSRRLKLGGRDSAYGIFVQSCERVISRHRHLDEKTIHIHRCKSIQNIFSILLNIMFHAPIGRFSVRINLLFYLFFYRRPIQQLFSFSYRPFVVNTFSTGLVGY